MYNDFLVMDEAEFCAMVRGSRLQSLDNLQYLRWAVAALLTPHSKKAVDPKTLMKLESDKIKSKQDEITEEERLRKKQEMEEVFKKWDAQNK